MIFPHLFFMPTMSKFEELLFSINLAISKYNWLEKALVSSSPQITVSSHSLDLSS